MNILGISAFYHDSAAALIMDGRVVGAAQEERFTRKKHDERFPTHAIEYCLQAGGIGRDDVDILVFYDKPLLKFERILETYVQFAPKGFESFVKAMPVWLNHKLWTHSALEKEFPNVDKILFTEHHESHAASAFFPSPFEEAAVLTIDGVGEYATTSYGVGRGNKLELLKEIHFPHSLGLLYSAFTYYTGFKVNSGEYKVMGLAPYGEPKYVDLIYKHLLDVKDDGSFRMDMDYFNYCGGLTMTSRRFDEVFGGPPRAPETPLDQRHMDLAASVQVVCEEVMLKMARHIREETGAANLVMAGGVALNCVGNGKIHAAKIFDQMWVQPAAGDAGGALGAALFTWYAYLDNPRTAVSKTDNQDGSLLGPIYTNDEIKSALDELGMSYEQVGNGQVERTTAELLANEKVVGWFQGRMEFGPRALGARSIIGDARSSKMQSTMNLKIKYRESFRPFAPSVLRDSVDKYFELADDSPYMLLVAPVQDSIRRSMSADEQGLFGIEKLNVQRSTIPAVTHVDYSARVQTVDEVRNKRYYRMIKEFEEKTGCPVIINTSFNVRGEPIVCTPEDAVRCFMRTEMDYLVIGDFVLDKTKQQAWEDDSDWRQEFELD